MALGHNAGRVDEALASIADLGKTIGPLAQKAAVLSEDADTLIKAIDAAKVNAVIANAQTFSQGAGRQFGRTPRRCCATARTFIRSSTNRRRSSTRRSPTSTPSPRRSIPTRSPRSSIPRPTSPTTVRQNRGNIDTTLKNAAEITAKLNDSADKLDGLMTSAQGFLGSPGTKGALGQVGEAAQSIKRLADNVECR